MVSLQNSAQTQVKYTRTSIYLPPLRSHDKVHERLSQCVHYSSASTRQHTGVLRRVCPRVYPRLRTAEADASVYLIRCKMSKIDTTHYLE